MQCSLVQCSVVPYSPVKCGNVQYSEVWYSAVQHRAETGIMPYVAARTAALSSPLIAVASRKEEGRNHVSVS